MINVSIVSYNTSDLLKKTLGRLLKQKDLKQSDLWVVDNASADDSALQLKKNFPDVNLIESGKNLGFGMGHNLALKEINSELILILNPDTEFEDDAVTKMVEFMEKNPEYGIVSCRLLDKKGKLVSAGGYFPTGLALFSWLFNLDMFGLPSFHEGSDEFYRKKEVDWVAGTFVVVRKRVLEEAGYFSPDYFMYFEDVDLCFRARNQGFKIGFNNDVEVIHYSGASSKNPHYAQWLGEFKGLLIFSYKNMGFLYGIFVQTLTVFAIILRIILFAITFKLDYSKTYLKVLTHL